ncbi:MAG: Levanase [Verrucomicrobia subdivision 3 bacterium]|nr:Levanase [Limisphaerales bacterium]MCS1413394.1 Levanase [Limisphaerales bacterium]
MKSLIGFFSVGLLAVQVGLAQEVVIADFEGDDYGRWTSEGNAFGSAPARGKIDGQQEVSGFQGRGLVNTFYNGDVSTGVLTSPEFQITDKFLAFLIGGGKHPGKTGIELLVAGEVVRTETGRDDERLEWASWEVSEFVGKEGVLRIFDRETEGYGHINIDHIVLMPRPRGHWDIGRLSDYRKTEQYYRERYRPQFHFTPEMHWMNDPNGMVYFRGEYHLFYQHNPHGNTWGHMSWGHAVSSDMVHWKHLPMGVHEEYGVMIFSGSAVVDWRNTSGFGNGSEPPLIAIYTGHGHGKQTQDIAYSNDRGRTWTKYAGNPVIDLNEKDFRDPKVMWHEPSDQWVMVVAMANDLYIQFYGSTNLRDWTLLSKFGPAGAKGKPNWECPDLFELPIEGEQGETRWVLEVDMGSQAIAGGSGGEYFIGHFDGREFKAEHSLDMVRWIDYGRDFYASVSWSDVPESDGRRLWLAWMNNWQTAILPTHPWRGAMSLPRSLALRRTPDGLRMVQHPVKELESLRGGQIRLDRTLLSSGTMSLAALGISGNQVEMVAEFEIMAGTEFGLRISKGDGEQTVVGYDVADEMMFVDRTHSGEVDFHPAFAGRHAGPLPPDDGLVRLHIFVDVSSVEVFGNHGYTVITDRIFPDPASQIIELYSKGGSTLLRLLEFWPLKSIWHENH